MLERFERFCCCRSGGETALGFVVFPDESMEWYGGDRLGKGFLLSEMQYECLKFEGGVQLQAGIRVRSGNGLLTDDV